MYLNKNDNTVIHKAKEVSIGGVTYPKQIFNSVSELEAIGIIVPTIEDKPIALNGHYVKQVIDYENNLVSYEQVELEEGYVEDTYVYVPQSLTPRQFRLALLSADLLDSVEALASQDKVIGIWFEYSLDIARDNAELVASASALGLTDDQIDNMFIEASKL